ncbi:hypothetical protein [Acinetobacter dispersus]|uniref:Type II secretion system protein GspG C-terminal domain-containing protein n=1 Tax=Acinetobacter dispersus TaxID=70348 RepID=N9L9R5_9GAMM|nr:hypothetical protein [Acinetobacter dispersus]ENW93018.1 hypothetical protein F904_02961 [Acinetobacter dispersus]
MNSSLSSSQRGITYLWMLFFVFLLSLGLGKSLEVFSLMEQRQKEQELLYVGKIYQEAIKQYYLSGQEENKYPAHLEDLLKDSRYIVTRRYIRQLYSDPLTNQDFLPIFSAEGGICGVKSRSIKKPVKTFFKEDELQIFTDAKSYQQWEFKSGCL